MDIPDDLKYSEEHQWVQVEDDIALVGISDFAQEQLGEIVFLELPEVGDQLQSGKPYGVVESAKTVSDLYAPVSGDVVEINDELPDSPESINSSPYEDGWLIKVKLTDPAELDDLLDAASYDEMIEDEE
ncbi:MAG TPA: glycine cleavage system protein GcvH [Pelovirga sp.]|nr:glycine cleavage system protein GcvH [Pelovirga sp.]